MKTTNKILLISLLLLAACNMADNEDLAMEGQQQSAKNSYIFRINATVKPESQSITTNDTLWIEINASDSAFTDLITAKRIAVDSNGRTTGVVRLKIRNAVTNANYLPKITVTKGRLAETNANGTVALFYGYPENNTEAKLGFSFMEKGIYAIGFINEPNPVEPSDKITMPLSNSLAGIAFYSYNDMAFNFTSTGYSAQAIVEYLFDHNMSSTPTKTTAEMLTESIYPQSIINVTIN